METSVKNKSGLVEEQHDDPSPWQDLVFSDPVPPEDYARAPASFDDSPPPQFVRTVNLIPMPGHDLRGPDDLDGIAARIYARVGEGISDVFAHEDYAGYEGEATESWARTIAEHQTGIPYTMPAYFYGAQKKVAEAIAVQGRYPLVGQCQQSATTALCLAGWDGGAYGDIGSGKGSQPYCASLGKGWTDVPMDLKKWSDELWDDVKPGACLFWSTDSEGVGHVVVVIRKHPQDRKWQLWDTGTSFYDPQAHIAAAKQARMLWESHWWDYIPKTISTNWQFRGVGLIKGLGHIPQNLRPRGRTRLILTRRSDKKLLFRSEWIDMEAKGWPISWILRGLRGAPFSDQIEAMFCVNSPPGQSTSNPKGLPLLDCFTDAKGNAKMAWDYSKKTGFHDRKDAAMWSPEAPYKAGDSSAVSVAQTSEAVTSQQVVQTTTPPPVDPSQRILQSALFSDVEELQKIVAVHGALRQGARGAGVKALQQGLVELGYDVPGGADGSFGKGTADALKKFQAEAGLGADGVAGAGTLKTMDQKLVNKQAAS